MTGKKDLRLGVLRNRRLLDERALNRSNNLIQDDILSFIHSHQCNCVHAFLPIIRNKEPDLWPVLKALFEMEIQVMTSVTDFQKAEMSHYWITPQTLYIEGDFGIPKPKNCKPADVSQVELVLIPLLAFDKSGHRLGYGKGYYDRLLRSLSADVIKMGLNFGPPFDSFPFVEPHDIKLDYCITPLKTYSFA